MNKRIIAGVMLNLMVGAFGTATINAAPVPDGKEFRKDIIDHRDKREFHRYNGHIRHTKAELKRDKHERRYLRRHGRYGAAAEKRHEIHRDRRHLRHEKMHRHYDRRHDHYGYHNGRQERYHHSH